MLALDLIRAVEQAVHDIAPRVNNNTMEPCPAGGFVACSFLSKDNGKKIK